MSAVKETILAAIGQYEGKLKSKELKETVEKSSKEKEENTLRYRRF